MMKDYLDLDPPFSGLKTLADIDPREIARMVDELRAMLLRCDFREAATLMEIWHDHGRDPNWIIDRLSTQDQADLYYALVPCWLCPGGSALEKLLRAVNETWPQKK